MKTNLQKQTIVKKMVYEIKSNTTIHIWSYKIAFPTVNPRVLRQYRELANAEYQWILKGMDEKYTNSIGEEMIENNGLLIFIITLICVVVVW